LITRTKILITRTKILITRTKILITRTGENGTNSRRQNLKIGGEEILFMILMPKIWEFPNLNVVFILVLWMILS
jgi:hypothetical protein